jgi:hypothetical protein
MACNRDIFTFTFMLQRMRRYVTGVMIALGRDTDLRAAMFRGQC